MWSYFAIINLPAAPLHGPFKGLTHKEARTKLEKMLRKRWLAVARLKAFSPNWVFFCQFPKM